MTKLYNNHWQPLDVVLLENIPWYLSIYLHSITITRHGQQIRPRKLKQMMINFIILTIYTGVGKINSSLLYSD